MPILTRAVLELAADQAEARTVDDADMSGYHKAIQFLRSLAADLPEQGA